MQTNRAMGMYVSIIGNMRLVKRGPTVPNTRNFFAVRRRYTGDAVTAPRQLGKEEQLHFVNKSPTPQLSSLVPIRN